MKHAMVQREGFNVPLIGIPADAVLDECDCCHELLGLSDLTWTGRQMLCVKCAADGQDQKSAPTEITAGPN